MASINLPSVPSELRPGRFGIYGGRYVPETLMAALVELEHEYDSAKDDAAFQAELADLLKNYAGRPHRSISANGSPNNSAAPKSTLSAKTCSTPARTRSTTLSARDCWPSAWGKAHHRRNRCRPARRCHGNRLRSARAGVRGLHGRRRYGAPGAERAAHEAAGRGSSWRFRRARRHWKDAISEAMRDWVTNIRTTYYLLGSALGAHPYPTMVRDFQRIISMR